MKWVMMWVTVTDVKEHRSARIVMLYVQTMTRNDYLTALVVWFDVGFTKIHKPIWLSTGPRMPRPSSPSSLFVSRTASIDG